MGLHQAMLEIPCSASLSRLLSNKTGHLSTVITVSAMLNYKDFSTCCHPKEYRVGLNPGKFRFKFPAII